MVVPRRRASALIAAAVSGGMRKPTVCEGAPAALVGPATAARVDGPADGSARLAAARGRGVAARVDAPLPGARDDVLRFAIPRRCATAVPVATRPRETRRGLASAAPGSGGGVDVLVSGRRSQPVRGRSRLAAAGCPEHAGFDPGRFVAECRAALAADPVRRRALRELVARAVSDPPTLMRAFGEPRRAAPRRLHVGPDLTVLHFAWPPGIAFKPHEHRTWGLIGVYEGGEDNIFRRPLPSEDGGPSRIEAAGAKPLRGGDVALLGEDVVHSVINPLPRFTCAVQAGEPNAAPLSRAPSRRPPCRARAPRPARSSPRSPG